MAGTAKEQLQMIWPERLFGSPPKVILPDGYRMRTFRPEDQAGHLRLMRSAGFEGWNEESLKGCLATVLPEGFFVVIHESTGQIVASAMATHNPSELHPFGGELGWLAACPDHRGKGLGTAVCAAVTARFLGAGYRRIYLRTDDWRLAAIQVYLKLGYVPFLHAPDMEGRWRAVCEKLAWPFRPAQPRRQSPSRGSSKQNVA